MFSPYLFQLNSINNDFEINELFSTLFNSIEDIKNLYRKKYRKLNKQMTKLIEKKDSISPKAVRNSIEQIKNLNILQKSINNTISRLTTGSANEMFADSEISAILAIIESNLTLQKLGKIIINQLDSFPASVNINSNFVPKKIKSTYFRNIISSLNSNSIQ